MIGQTILHYRIRRILRSPSHYFTGRLTREMKQRSPGVVATFPKIGFLEGPRVSGPKSSR